MGLQDSIAFTIPEAVAATKMSRSEIYRAFNRGDLTPRKSGRRTLILRDELVAICPPCRTRGRREARCSQQQGRAALKRERAAPAGSSPQIS